MPPAQAEEFSCDLHRYIRDVKGDKRQNFAFTSRLITVEFQSHVAPTGHASQLSVDATRPSGRYRPAAHTSQVAAPTILD
eukprot:118339-Prymnesium_polylepis.1